MNRLQFESSLYLRQHAQNPVDWYPWGPEALAKARELNKPIIVSIGYSACHWCHVMEHETFENEHVAAVMNAKFICIKVDREERPDIDTVYMEALQAMGLRGGWPLNVFLMPDAKPFYGGTYFPPTQWRNLLLSIDRAFHEEYDKLANSAEGFAQSLQLRETERYQFSIATYVAVSPEIQRRYLQTASQNFDTERGGEQRVPKFPMPALWEAVLHAIHHQPDAAIQQHLRYTLTRIAIGGIYDHVGGGWTRYSTDGEWKVPHFEKMLYDNGQLISVYAQAVQYFKSQTPQEPFWIGEWAIERAIDWLANEMMSEEGGFYAAQDADSEGVEGKYYTWEEEELEKILEKDFESFANEYNIYIEGNWEHGRNVLHLDTLPTPDRWQQLRGWHQKLAAARNARVKPVTDRKFICSWNALTLNGLAMAYRVTRNEQYKVLALKNAQFFKEYFIVDVQNAEGKIAKGLWHLAEPGGSPAIVGFLDDYAATIRAFVQVYQITFDDTWIQLATQLANYALANFSDAAAEPFLYFSDSQAEELIARKKEIFDNVIPASNSLLSWALYELSFFTDRADFREVAEKQMQLMQGMLETNASWLGQWWQLALRMSHPLTEISIVGKDVSTIKEKLDKVFDPNRLFSGTEEVSSLPILEGRQAMNQQTTIYICQDKTCLVPVFTVDDAWKILDKLP